MKHLRIRLVLRVRNVIGVTYYLRKKDLNSSSTHCSTTIKECKSLHLLTLLHPPPCQDIHLELTHEGESKSVNSFPPAHSAVASLCFKSRLVVKQEHFHTGLSPTYRKHQNRGHRVLPAQNAGDCRGSGTEAPGRRHHRVPRRGRFPPSPEGRRQRVRGRSPTGRPAGPRVSRTSAVAAQQGLRPPAALRRGVRKCKCGSSPARPR